MSSNQDNASGMRQRVWQALTAGKRRVVLLSLLGVALVIALGVNRLDNYVTESRAYCLSCHDVAQADLANSSHASLGCSECHEAQFGQNASLFFKKLSKGKEAYTPHARAHRERCNVCHLSGQRNDYQIANTAGHQAHVLREPHIECAVCHGSDSHRLSVKPGICQTCHKDVKIFHANRPNLDCMSCHNFLAPTSTARKPAITDCQRCHGGKVAVQPSRKVGETLQGPEVSTAMVHGNAEACRLCHNPHEPDPAKRTTGSTCGRCHEGMVNTIEQQDSPAHKQCGSCHQVHELRAAVRNACARCHEDARPGAPVVNAALKHDRCIDCHKPHTFSAKEANCAGCHEPKASTLAARGPKQHSDCRGCHAPHEAGHENVACRDCHAGKAGHGHARCSICHEPHGGKADTKQCGTCHGGQSEALGAIPQHRAACSSCHPSHATAGASTRCGACHANQAGSVAKSGNTSHKTCASCHKPHAFAASAPSATCKGCHAIGQGSHKGECRQCHAAHGSPLTAADSCKTCHKAVRPTAGKHSNCRSCHKPHEAASAAGDCAKCHKPQASSVTAWSPTQHKTCANCHPAHNPNAGAACSTCHASQAKTVTGSKHSCASCHSPHQTPGNWWNQCSNCHGAISRAVKGRGPYHSRCNACHKPHSFGKPSCTACHNAMSSLGAHGASGHKQCAACHGTHEKRAIPRSTCLSCHKAKVDHHPEAQTCTSCHMFR